MSDTLSTPGARLAAAKAAAAAKADTTSEKVGVLATLSTDLAKVPIVSALTPSPTVAPSASPSAAASPSAPVGSAATVPAPVGSSATAPAPVGSSSSVPVSSAVEAPSTKRPLVMIATPCAGGMLYHTYHMSVLNLLQSPLAKQVDFKCMTFGNESLVTRARNACIAEFLATPAATHLLFIDADIGFSWITVAKLLEANLPVACVPYPKKDYNWEKMSRAAQAGMTTVKGLQMASVDYVLNFVHDTADDASTNSGGHADASNGVRLTVAQREFVEVAEGGTGFMMIQRHVFDVMRARYPHLKYTNDLPSYERLSPGIKDCFYLFMDTMHDPDSDRYLSEDYAFCKRWRECGGRVWMLGSVNLSHTGTHTFYGQPLMQVLGLIPLSEDVRPPAVTEAPEAAKAAPPSKLEPRFRRPVRAPASVTAAAV